MPNIQIADLVRYREHVEGQRPVGCVRHPARQEQGVWLVTSVGEGVCAGLVYLRQGNERRYSHVSLLDKISSSR